MQQYDDYGGYRPFFTCIEDNNQMKYLPRLRLFCAIIISLSSHGMPVYRLSSSRRVAQPCRDVAIMTRCRQNYCGVLSTKGTADALAIRREENDVKNSRGMSPNSIRLTGQKRTL